MKKRTGKTAKDIRQAKPTIKKHNDEFSPKMLMNALESIAEGEGCTPTYWVRRSQELWKRWAEKDAVEEKWDEALADTITIDGFFCMDNEPSIHVIAFKEGNLVYYNGETLKPVEMMEALRILRDINDAAQWFMVEPWNGGDCSFSGNAAWYSRLLMTLGTALQLPKKK